jgi:hypothetical protein
LSWVFLRSAAAAVFSGGMVPQLMIELCVFLKESLSGVVLLSLTSSVLSLSLSLSLSLGYVETTKSSLTNTAMATEMSRCVCRDGLKSRRRRSKQSRKSKRAKTQCGG